MTAQRRCKILCTLGPASRSPAVLGAMLDAGMDAARLNFSHGSHADHARTYETVRRAAAERDRAVAVVADLQGPKIRLGTLPDDGIDLHDGSTVVLRAGVRDGAVVGDEATILPTPFEPLAREVSPGDPILLADGAVELEVLSVDDADVTCRVVHGGKVASNKGINLPGTRLSIPALTDKDVEDLAFALELGVDLVALSFVRHPDDLARAREVMDRVGRRCPLVAKIEKPQAIEHLEDIVRAADGIMVARGDLGVEMGPEVVPILQKRVIEAANRTGKLVITATQMLESMIEAPRPTRAEASDVANAVLDGSDALMLSAETAVGRHPALVVETMARIIRTTEAAPRYWSEPPEALDFPHTTNAIARAAVDCARTLPEVRAIVTYTGSGGIARLVSDYRPHVPIWALTPNERTFHALALYWGVTPRYYVPDSTEGDRMFADIDAALLRYGFSPGDQVVITFGHPVEAHTSVNLLRIHRVGSFAATR
ncbi:MAG: pyruvate kinase, partial [Deltaproteobacteria bacterium]